MSPFNQEQLGRLLASQGGPHISLFLPPPHTPHLAEEDRIRISNLARETLQTLVENWMPEQEAESLLKPLYDLEQDPEFLSPRRCGVAIFLSADFFQTYRVSEPIEQQLVIARAFHVRPLLLMADQFSPFYLLTLSKQRVALFRATLSTISPVEDAELPPSFKASAYAGEAEPASQVHSAAAGVTSKQGAVFHGQGGIKDAEKDELVEYLKQVDEAVCAYLHDRSGFLILAGVDYETAMYQKISVCAQRLGCVMSGNFEFLSPEELLEKATPMAIEQFGQQRQADSMEVREPRHRPVTHDPEQLLSAAHVGRIDTLFFDRDSTLYGSFDSETRTLKEMRQAPEGKPSEPSHDLIEYAIVQTIEHGGRVHALPTDEMPVNARMAAILRY